jgi:hypothetical protein
MKESIKFLVITLVIIVSSQVYCQYDESAPWMKNISSKKQKATLENIKASFDEYWKTHDPNIKGSGHKPFMRWYNDQENQLHDDGTILTSQEILDIYKEEKQKYAQKNAANISATSNWKPVFGTLPYNSPGQGRIHAVAVDQKDNNIIYVGTASGGIWKSTNAGTTFLPMFDEFPQIGVSGIAIDPKNSKVIYITTGDRDHSDTTCIGVFKSIDGGATWTITGKTVTSGTASDIYVSPTDSNMVWVATSQGVFRSLNAGESWTKTLEGNIKDIKIKPTDPKVVYAVSKDTFYKSVDSGATFTATSTGLPAASGRLVIDVTPANPNYIYVISAKTDNSYQGVYKSIDSGATFTTTNTTANLFGGSTQAWYDLALGVSDTNAEEIYTGCLSVMKSLDGGVTFSSVAGTHADIHILRFFNNKLYNGNDGGIYTSTDKGAKFTDLTKSIQNQQIYKIAVAKQTSAIMYTGHQDNGCHAFVNNNQWKRTQGADGMDVAIDPTNQNVLYGMIQYGQQFYKNTTAGANNSSNIAGLPTGEGNGNWVTPLAINSKGQVFSGFTKLFKLVDNKWAQQSTGTLGTGNIDLVEVDPSNDNIMYVINGTQLFKSTDGGVNFTNAYSASANISSLTVHSSDSNIVYITTAGTSGQAMKSTNGGTSFTNIASGLPAIGKFCIKHQGGTVNNPLFVGTNLGVYYYDDSTTSWTPFDTNLPNTKVSDLEINYVDKNITASTFGRGVWRTSLPSTLASEEFEQNIVSIYPNPSSEIFNIKLGDIQPKSLDVTDISGKIIYSKKVFDNTNNNDTQINLSNMSNGVYFIKIATDRKSVTKKIIKN